jgi:DNA-binding response OmpR family regulator
MMMRLGPVVLVVEDETLIALMIEDALEAAGFRLGGVAESEADAFRLAEQQPPDFAVLDLNLGRGGCGLNIGRILHSRGTGILYASGSCADYMHEMAATGAHACLAKPYMPDDVPRALALLPRLSRGEVPEDLPSALRILAPG